VAVVAGPRAARQARRLRSSAGKPVEMPIYWRPDMVIGARIAGPALIAEDETTTFVSRSFDATIDAARSIVLTRKTA
jgi:N-methylhydantoinase A